VIPKTEAPKAVRRLLHINHPPTTLRLLEKFCQTKKVMVDSFESGAVGLHHALTRKYHMIVLGAPIPGADFIRILKGISRAKVAAQILLVAEPRVRNRDELLRFPNVLGCIGKPLDINEFSRYLESVLKPAELEPKEKERLVSVLRKWEQESLHAG
jgi:DNA-binding response OmpR family regulator